MVGRVSDGASERKLVITEVPLLPCLCPPTAAPSAWTLYPHCILLSSGICRGSLSPHRSCRVWIVPSLVDTFPPVFSRSRSVFWCFCTASSSRFTVNLHVHFCKTSTSEAHLWQSTASTELFPAISPTRMTYLLNITQRQPHLLQRLVLNGPDRRITPL